MPSGGRLVLVTRAHLTVFFKHVQKEVSLESLGHTFEALTTHTACTYKMLSLTHLQHCATNSHTHYFARSHSSTLPSSMIRAGSPLTWSSVKL